MLKKIVVSLLAIMMLAIPVQTVCFAESVNAAVPDATVVAPHYVSVVTHYVSLVISGGTAKCGVDYSLVNTNYTAKCQIYLEYSSNQSNWVQLASWTENGSNYECYEKKRNLGFTETYYYRTRSVLTVYNANGNYVEQVEGTSNVVNYTPSPTY